MNCRWEDGYWWGNFRRIGKRGLKAKRSLNNWQYYDRSLIYPRAVCEASGVSQCLQMFTPSLTSACFKKIRALVQGGLKFVGTFQHKSLSLMGKWKRVCLEG